MVLGRTDAAGQVSSVGDGRDDRLGDQELGVIAFLVGVAGQDHHQVQVGDDLDQLAGEPSSEEARWEFTVVVHHW